MWDCECQALPPAPVRRNVHIDYRPRCPVKCVCSVRATMPNEMCVPTAVPRARPTKCASPVQVSVPNEISMASTGHRPRRNMHAHCCPPPRPTKCACPIQTTVLDEICMPTAAPRTRPTKCAWPVEATVPDERCMPTAVPHTRLRQGACPEFMAQKKRLQRLVSLSKNCIFEALVPPPRISRRQPGTRAPPQ